MIVRADGTNNGVWFTHRHLWVQNEDTGKAATFNGTPGWIPTESLLYRMLLNGDIRPPSRSAHSDSPVRTSLIGKLERPAADIEKRPELVAGAGRSKRGIAIVHSPEANRQRIEKVLGRAATAAQVKEVFDKYGPVLNMFGDPVRGKKVFVAVTCSTCHRCQGLGREIGPDLDTLVDRSPQTLLAAVCDPNRTVLERFSECIAIRSDGQTCNGMLLKETSNSVTLLDRDAKRTVILRRDLDELIYTGRSHMPEGLPAKMTVRQMADLFAFVNGKGPPPK